MTHRRARPLAEASSGRRLAAPRPSTSVETGHAKLPSAVYRNRTKGSTEAKITRAGNRAAKSVAHRDPARCLIKLIVDGSAPRPAAMVHSSGTKLAPGTTTALATESTAPSRVAAIQNPQKPARRASHALTPPEANKAIAAAAICIGKGCEIQDAASNDGTLPAATAKPRTPTHSAVPNTSMQIVPMPPHTTSRAPLEPRAHCPPGVEY